MAAIDSIIETCVQGMGYELVDLEFAGRGLLRVSIDLKDSDPRALLPIADDSIRRVTLEDCESVNRQLTHVLMVEDIDYQRLEIASPGLDRPLRTLQDFRRFAGFTVALKLRMPFKGRRSYQGVLSVDETGQLALELDAEPLHGVTGKQQAKALAAKGRAGKAAPVAKAPSKSALKKAAALEARKQMLAQRFVQDGSLPGLKGDEEFVTRLEFSLDEIEKARLVPVV